MKEKVIYILTYLFSLTMIVISVFAMYVFLVLKSQDKKTPFQMDIGEVKSITMMDNFHNTNKIIITDKQDIKCVLYLIKEMTHQPVCFSIRKALIIKGEKGEIDFGLYNNCLQGVDGEYICDINIEKFIIDVYGNK